uniref:Uncharacterized protein n=1 Tax=Echinococcus granulosus TaxID=6210 RepID=U6FR57_ECHGR|nr:hypothetical protein EgrG_002062000 [Echinococcus granulosus]
MLDNMEFLEKHKAFQTEELPVIADFFNYLIYATVLVPPCPPPPVLPFCRIIDDLEESSTNFFLYSSSTHSTAFLRELILKTT